MEGLKGFMDEIIPNKLYGYRTIGKNGWLRVGEAGVYNLILKGHLKSINVSAGTKYKKYAVLGEDILIFLREREIKVTKQ